MTQRLMQALLLFLLSACGAAPSSSAAQSGGRPFAISPVATFNSPWAMDFLPGSGVAKTNVALVTEKAGRLWLVDVTTGRKQQVAGVPQVTSRAGGACGGGRASGLRGQPTGLFELPRGGAKRH